jgi:drug/metabolite transporter (DMT)-like permease
VPSTPRHRLALAIGLVLVSTSGPFIRMADMPTFTTVFWRMALAGPLFLLVARALPRAHLRAVLLGAALLAAHFLLWVGAFAYTDYASNLILLVAQPIMGAVASARLGEPTSARMWWGVGLAFAGLCVIAGGDVSLGPRALLGDAMCLAADLAMTLFYVVTRHARRAMPLPAFMGWTFVLGAAMTLPAALLAGQALVGHTDAQWGWLLALVVITTMAGHGAINFAARGVSLFAVNFVIVLEPAIAIGMGALLFHAPLGVSHVIGGAILAAAVIVGLAPRRAPQA